MKIELTDDMTASIVISELKETYIGIQRDINRLINIKIESELKSYQLEDLKDCLYNSHCVTAVLKYFMTSDEYCVFLSDYSNDSL